MMRMRVLVSLADGRCAVDTWMTAAKQEPPVKGKPLGCGGCPLRVGGEWDANAVASLAAATTRQRQTLRKRWGCHAAERPCAGMARIVAKLEQPETGEEWGFFLGQYRPPIEPGERLYVVAHDRLRGYAPVTAVECIDGRWAIGRKGGAVAVTIEQRIEGFRGWRKAWWKREDERPFPDWRTADLVPKRKAATAVHAAKSASDDPRADGKVQALCSRWVTSIGPAVTCKGCLAELGPATPIVEPDDHQIALFRGAHG